MCNIFSRPKYVPRHADPHTNHLVINGSKFEKVLNFINIVLNNIYNRLLFTKIKLQQKLMSECLPQHEQRQVYMD